MLNAMLLTKRLRRWISSGVTVALLFMQLATAAYACPQLAKDLHPPVSSAPMPGCEGMAVPMDQEQPQLCKAHCVKDVQGTGAATAPDLQANPAALALVVGIVEPVQPALPQAAAAAHSAAAVRPPGAPPLYLSLLVFRN